jgi:hypothetical protein
MSFGPSFGRSFGHRSPVAPTSFGPNFGRSFGRSIAELRVAIDENAEVLRRHMGVLHEETLDRIAALAPDFGPIRREFREADANLHEEFDRRPTPLEAQARRRRR